MSEWRWRNFLTQIVSACRQPNRRKVPQLFRGDFGSEQLESRTLLSAGGRRGVAGDQVAAHVDMGPKRFLNHLQIGGPWTLQATGQFPGQGAATMLHSGYNAQTMHIQFVLAGLNEFKFVDRFTRETPTMLSGKTQKVALPGFAHPVKLTVTLNFDNQTQSSPSTLTGTIQLPDGETLVTLTGTYGAPST